ncbi:flagellar basal body-associated protein FliL [Ferrimonas balearica]|uniref:flagellar basal body-associated protein FliL n=1 Tax=Ferrimonas balearica TaxID=44012 RepID=UPI0021BD0549|nr:flagellar basal body-associated protein FliL [Ferrimonas balearica]
MILLVAALVSLPGLAEEEAAPIAHDNYGYYGLEPEIVTNYVSPRKRLGFVRVSVELMLKDADTMELVEHHAPLIRATIVEILGQQPEEKIKSLSGREQIRRDCYDTVNALLAKEVGQPLVANLLFTRYLYD